MRPDGQHTISAGDKDLSRIATSLRLNSIPELTHCSTLLKDGATHCSSSWSLGTELELVAQPMEKGCRNTKAQDCALSLYLHCKISPCAFTTPFKRLQILPVSSEKKGHRSGMISFQYLSDLPWTELIPDRNGHLKTYFQKSMCAVQ